MNHHGPRLRWQPRQSEPEFARKYRPVVRRIAKTTATIVHALVLFAIPHADAKAAGGVLTLRVGEEPTDDQPAVPTITRLELWRGSLQGSQMPLRKATPAGVGVVLDRSMQLSLNEGTYAFRMVRGPEYRVVNGTFSLEKTSEDSHSVLLPRTVHMIHEGWTSGDCCVPASQNSVPLRMASEDLHVAAVLGHVVANPIPYRDRDDPILHEPTWIREDTVHHEGLVLYGQSTVDASRLPSELLAAADPDSSEVRIAIENPFAWPLPVWLASGRVDGFFVLGDWLQLDRQFKSVGDGRGPDHDARNNPLAMGSWAYRIYTNMLEAGLRIPPLAGSGNMGTKTPIGYNRLYVTQPDSFSHSRDDQQAVAVQSSEAWWNAAWSGHSVATNGPLMRPKLAGKLPGHVFAAATGEKLQLRPELSLTTRDPVEYLEVIHNGQVHYRARLDEFAKAGGKIPPLTITKSGWVILHVVTKYEDHFRAAISAPWYIEFDGKPRVDERAVKFFQDWLGQYEERLKRLPADQLARHVPFVRAARKFWSDRLY